MLIETLPGRFLSSLSATDASYFTSSLRGSETVTPLVVRPPRGVADIAASKDHEEQHSLDEEPRPAALALHLLRLPSGAPAATRSRLVGRLRSVQVLGADRDDVVVIAELASLGTKAEVGDLRDRWRLAGLEAQRPVALALVLQLELQLLVLEVRQTGLGRDAGMTDSPRRAPGKFGLFSVRVFVIRRLAVAHHGHDEGEHHTRAVVLVRVEKDAEPLKLVGSAEYGSKLCTVLGEPHGEAVAVELVLAVDLELDLDLPVCGGQGYPRP